MLLVKDILPERCRRGIYLEKCLPALSEVKKKKREMVFSQGVLHTREEKGQGAYLESCKVLIVG